VRFSPPITLVLIFLQLDSTAAREVIAHIKQLALEEGIIVIATIHQPAMDTLFQFSNLLLIAEGKTCYLGPVHKLEDYLEEWGHPTPRYFSRGFHICKPALTLISFIDNTR
jgi:ABC-type multidrug transport system ATPase subunit